MPIDPKNTDLIYLIEDISTSFERLDLQLLSEQFKRVIVISTNANLNHSNSNVSGNVISFDSYSTKKYFLHSIAYSKWLFKEFIMSGRYFFNVTKIKDNYSKFLRTLYLSEKIGQIVDSESSSNSICFYSFWFTNLSLASSHLKRSNKFPGAHYYTRVHGTDLYEERVPKLKRIAFRSYQLNYIDKVFSVSKKGEKYLKDMYPEFANKISCNYLGTLSRPLNRTDQNNVFTIVSCSHIRNIKRVYLIPKILKHINFKVKWIHIGRADDQDPTTPLLHVNMKELSTANPSVDIELKGDMTHEAIMDLYESTPINLFLSVSETEGLPVSMMEAISFGIPLMATNVGGCNEIVNSQTGILLERDFDFKEVAKLISDFERSTMNTLEFRKGVVEFWSKAFCATENMKRFISNLN